MERTPASTNSIQMKQVLYKLSLEAIKGPNRRLTLNLCSLLSNVASFFNPNQLQYPPLLHSTPTIINYPIFGPHFPCGYEMPKLKDKAVLQDVMRCGVSDATLLLFLDLLYLDLLKPRSNIDQSLEILVLCYICGLDDYASYIGTVILNEMPPYGYEIIELMVIVLNTYKDTVSKAILDLVLGLLASHPIIQDEFATKLVNQRHINLATHVLKEWIVVQKDKRRKPSPWGGLYSYISSLVRRKDGGITFSGGNITLFFGPEELKVHDWVLFGRWKYFRELSIRNPNQTTFTLPTDPFRFQR